MALGVVTPADKLALINSVITGASALVALLAAWVAARALRAQVQLARLQRRDLAYRSFIAEPAFAILPEFEATAIDNLAEGEADVRSLIAQNAPIVSVHQRAQALTERFRALLEPPYYRIVGAAGKWDEQLAADLQTAFGDLEDDVSLATIALPTGASPAPALASRVRAGVANIGAIIARYDVGAIGPTVLYRARVRLAKLPVLKLLAPRS